MPHKSRQLKLYSKRWLLARRVTQILTFLAFLIIFLSIKQWHLEQPLSALPFWLDPFAMLSINLSGQIWVPLTLLSLLTVILTVGFGRGWCGWICPLGTLFDIMPSQKGKQRVRLDERWRKIKHMGLIASITAALFGCLVLVILDPLALLFRSLTAIIWPALNQLITFIEKLLYPLPLFKDLVNGFESSVRPVLFPLLPENFRYPLVFGILIISIILLNLIRERFWCRYLCPLGSGLGLLSRYALIKRQVDQKCTQCGICASRCPTGTIDPDHDYRSDPVECTLCMRCLAFCPHNATRFSAGNHPPSSHEYDPTKRDLLRAAVFSTAALFLLKLGNTMIPKTRHPHLILPPGAASDDFYSRCIRCSECMRVCPTSGLQASFSEAGLEGFWTPVLVPRIGHCEYNCNACGRICPTSAIKPLPLEDKHVVIIGTAFIDQNRCIAWGEHLSCIVCQEVCPLPQKAIILEDGLTPANQPIKLPRVDPERCIGCGTCENKCPVEREAAIRVYNSEYLPHL